ncbi:ubiquitin-like domain-containing protein [Cohnella soli]|uniref:Ubiquitin-like domain-containing protein n=1 Tax=Cohnella soli TaxID=425005 RepID=A0ABW0I0C5_9BACL
MGSIPVEETHDPRPTGKLIALRWKHEHLRVAILGAILVFAITMMFMSLLQKAATKNITIIDNGVASVIATQTNSVEELLAERNIHVGPYDTLSGQLTDKLDEGSRIVIDRAVSITVKADGKEQRVHTTADTVSEALGTLNLGIAGEDRVTPAIGTSLAEGMTVSVVRVRKEMTETKLPIAFKVLEQKNADLEVGKTKVIKQGKAGVVVYKTERVYEDGKLVSQEMVEKVIAQPAVQKVVAIGTKKKAEVATASFMGRPRAGEVQFVSLNGKQVKIRRLLTNVTLTAYSAGFSSTGKKKGDSDYGVTASGAVVQEGRTIAVDPRVIPIGWWVYIEGIGFRRAEDTGGAIKGKKIDVYYESESHVDKFGTKRGFKVYVIGPVKPSAD